MSFEEIFCDLLVVGAGPAGGSAAYQGASKGIKVVILEKKKEVGIPVQCAEYIPTHLALETDLPSEIIVQRIKGMCTCMPDGSIVTTNVPGFLINRDKFDKYLTEKAVSKGAELYLESKVFSYEDGVVWAKRKEEILKIFPKVIIGADGALSTVGKWIESENKKYIYTLQYLMPLKEEKECTFIYFRKDIPGGYGWVFPKGKVANVGVGVNPKFKIKPRYALEKFILELIKEEMIDPERLSITGGAIPTGGLNKLYKENIILVGDAGGFVHPITGAGVSNAYLSGRLGGDIAYKAIAEDDIKLLVEYEEECKDFFLDIFHHAGRRRKLLEKCWEDEDYDLNETLKYSWIAFKEYYD